MLTLRELKYLVRDALFEGVEQDRQELIKSFPEQENDISRLGPKWIMWLMARFGPSAKFEEIHPFADALATVKNYSQRDAAISQKYNSSEQWRQAVDQAFPNKKWKNPADVMTMTSDDMETLLAMSQRKKQNVDVSQVSNVEQDRIGKIGPWNLWMPTTRENSCQIAGYDPVTMKHYTTWCTARTSGSNLFYNYVGKEGVILFYLIKDNATKPTDRLSVGFVNGKPLLKGQNGGLSVDGHNNGLTEKNLRSLLGGHYDQIMATLQDVADKNKGNHPAQKKFVEAAQSITALKSMLKGLTQEEIDDLLELIAEQKILSSEVALYLCQIGDLTIRQLVAKNPNNTVEVLMQLARDDDSHIRSRMALNLNTPTEVLMHLSYDQDSYVVASVAQNPNTPAEVLAQIANHKYPYVRAKVAQHPNTPIDTLIQLAQDKDEVTRMDASEHPKMPTSILQQMLNDEAKRVRQTASVALNKRQQNKNKVYERVLRRLRSLI